MSKHLKLKDFLSELSTKNIPIDILALQETWNIPYPHLIHIPGYNFIHHQRDKIKGGGVGFYIQENITYNIVENLSPFIPKLFESLSIEVTINNKKKHILLSIQIPFLKNRKHANLPLPP